MSETTTDPAAIEVERYLTRMRDIQDLAHELNVSRDYIKAMQYNGFTLPGGKASIRMARDFLATCPAFQVRKTTRANAKEQPRVTRPPADASFGK